MSRSEKLHAEASVSLRTAKAKLSSLTKQARSGTRVVITSHGTPVADLVPHGAGATTPLLLKRPGPLPKPFRLKSKGPSLSELVLTDRVG